MIIVINYITETRRNKDTEAPKASIIYPIRQFGWVHIRIAS